MILAGCNPHIIDYNGESEHKRWLESLTPKTHNRENKDDVDVKSVYFFIRPFPGFSSQSWFYENGVFPAEFYEKVDTGGEGQVIGGELKDATEACSSIYHVIEV